MTRGELSNRGYNPIAMCTQLIPSDEPQLCDDERNPFPLRRFGAAGCPACGMRHPVDAQHADGCAHDDDGVAFSGACPVDAIDAMS